MDAVVSHFMKAAPELMEREFEREGVKLHVTLMNSRFQKLKEQNGSGVPSHDTTRRKRAFPNSFDCRMVFRVSNIPL